MKRFIAVCVLTLVAACAPAGPSYETHYEFVPPPTDTGKMCATTCLYMKQTCRQNCDVLAGQCRISDKQQSQSEYRRYVEERQRLGRPLKKSERDFDYGYHSGCNSSMSSCQQQCESTAMQCHTSCGGQVIPHTTCVSNCQPAAQPYAMPAQPFPPPVQRY